jgi:hypothetical protein
MILTTRVTTTAACGGPAQAEAAPLDGEKALVFSPNSWARPLRVAHIVVVMLLYSNINRVTGTVQLGRCTRAIQYYKR